MLMGSRTHSPQVDRFTAPSADSVITQLLIFGTQLLALTEAGNELLIFNLETTGATSSQFIHYLLQSLVANPSRLARATRFT